MNWHLQFCMLLFRVCGGLVSIGKIGEWIWDQVGDAAGVHCIAKSGFKNKQKQRQRPVRLEKRRTRSQKAWPSQNAPLWKAWPCPSSFRSGLSPFPFFLHSSFSPVFARTRRVLHPGMPGYVPRYRWHERRHAPRAPRSPPCPQVEASE